MDTPSNFVPHEMWPEYDWLGNPPDLCAKERVPGSPCGIRWSLWPFTFEEHIGDEEPNLRTGGRLARPRLVSWKRVRRTDVPQGWHEGQHPWRVDAYHRLGANYASRWEKRSRRELRFWREEYLGSVYAIEPVTWDEYKAAYKHSTVVRKIGEDQLNQLGRKVKSGGPELWGVRNIKTGEIIAGTALHYSPAYKSSMRECPFILPEARKCFAMTGLIAYWFDRSLARGIELQIFSYFAHSGTPKGWEGFSAYKKHFGVTEVSYPPVLYRFVWGKVF